MKKKISLLIIIIIFLIISLLYLFIRNNKRNDINKLFDNKEESYLITDLYEGQELINGMINEYVNDSKYKIDNAKVVYNPYNISPLSGIIMFQSNKNYQITIRINDEDVTKYNVANKNVIPIYGLLNNYNNKIELVTDDVIYVYYIQTDNVDDKYPLIVNKAYSSLNDDLYFLSGPVKTGLSAYDKKGQLRWILTSKFTMDMEFLPNGHFLVGLSQGNLRDRKIGFVEMDYLGKIYNYYILKNGYDFEFQILSNGNYMLAGGNVPLNYTNSYIYEINPSNGDVISYLDVTDVLLSIDDNIDKNKISANAIRNGFYYDENTKNVIVSLREINSLVSINYETKKLNWIYTGSNYFTDKFNDYLVKDNEYPKGQHSPFITSDNHIGFYNNLYDRYNLDLNYNNYKNKSSKAVIIDITDDLKVNKLWDSSDYVKGYFNQKYGYFRVLNNGNKLIDYGWVIHDNKNNKKMDEFESDIDSTYAKIIELDSNNNIVFDGTCEEGKYRVFKNKLYLDEINSTDITKLKYINTLNSSKYNKVRTIKIKDEINEAIPYNYSLLLTKNTIDTNYKYNMEDVIDIYLVSNKDNTYIYHYKEKDKDFDSTLNINIPKGKYLIYLKINDILYNTNKITVVGD